VGRVRPAALPAVPVTRLVDSSVRGGAPAEMVMPSTTGTVPLPAAGRRCTRWTWETWETWEDGHV
jgi:hypothetical protein